MGEIPPFVSVFFRLFSDKISTTCLEKYPPIGKYDKIKISPKKGKKVEHTSMVVSAESDEPEPEPELNVDISKLSGFQW